MPDYSKMTTEDFDRILNRKVQEYGTAWLMSLPGVYEIVSEELNNEVLDAWAAEQPDEQEDAAEEEED